VTAQRRRPVGPAHRLSAWRPGANASTRSPECRSAVDPHRVYDPAQSGAARRAAASLRWRPQTTAPACWIHAEIFGSPKTRICWALSAPEGSGAPRMGPPGATLALTAATRWRRAEPKLRDRSDQSGVLTLTQFALVHAPTVYIDSGDAYDRSRHPYSLPALRPPEPCHREQLFPSTPATVRRCDTRTRRARQTA
jgi:hypothetical protein